MLNFHSSVKLLPGVGETRARLLGKLDITDVGGLLRHFPRAYQHRGNIIRLIDASDGETGAFLLTVRTEPQTKMLKNRMTITKFSAFDETGRCVVTFFNNRFVNDIFHVGEEFRFWGKISIDGGGYSLGSPAYERAGAGNVLPEFFPVYPLTGTLTQKFVGSTIRTAINRLPRDAYPEIVPKDALAELGLCGPDEAYSLIHNPENYAELERGRSYFIFEELYLFALGMLENKAKRPTGGAPLLGRVDSKPFIDAIPFGLTGAQKRVINEIYADMTSEKRIPMARLVSGDVGSGKTVCAAAAVYFTVKSGYQASLMAPTEILASQHYNDLSELFARLGFSVALLTGSTPAAEKRRIKAGLADGTIDFVIGTHALLTGDVIFRNPALVITDEQHRFGVMQRTALAEKGRDLHVLVMSATPIPRTLALIIYGDLDMSVIDEMPPGRQKVGTFAVNEGYRDRLNGFIGKCVAEGGQVYIVCPSVEDNNDASEDSEDEAGGESPGSGYTISGSGVVGFDFDGVNDEKPRLKSAVGYAKKLREEIFPKLRVGFIHGRLKASEKDAVMREFAAGNIDILVSTTVIEVGINVPNASLMIVENAERFGLSQLHQLRGRVGRGSRKSYCILVSDSKSETSVKRLEVMCGTNDGYKIAQADLDMRGPGDFLPNGNGTTRQHGELRFRFANLCGDMELLKKAFDYAAKLPPGVDARAALTGWFGTGA